MSEPPIACPICLGSAEHKPQQVHDHHCSRCDAWFPLQAAIRAGQRAMALVLETLPHLRAPIRPFDLRGADFSATGSQLCLTCGKWLVWSDEGTPKRGWCQCPKPAGVKP